ncbi:MAG: DNA translocase FtsK [Oscillospiraceae bacterium]|nr:DNA translocase FtsK [Oscillospiraceae bacterium]
MDLMESGKDFKGGGLFSAVLGIPLLDLFGKVGASIIIILLMLFLVLLLSNKTVVDVLRWFKGLGSMFLEARPQYEPAPEKTVPQKKEPESIPLPSHAKDQPKAKPLFGGLLDKKKPAPAEGYTDPAEANRRDFDVDIAFPFEKRQPKPVEEKKPRSLEQFNYDPVFDVPDETEPQPSAPEKSETELEVERYQEQIDLEQRRLAYELQKRQAEAEEASPAAESRSLDDIIKKAAQAGDIPTAPVQTTASVSAPASAPVTAARPSAEPSARSASQAKPYRSTLASNQIGDDEDLDLPETTARDIQNEITENESSIVEYEIPPIDLLKPSQNDLNTAQAEDEIRENCEILLATLRSFGIEAEIVAIKRGPTVTRYELLPRAGIKIAKIRQLSDDIALRLASKGGIRIEAPIPGKAAVGIEVPNKIKDVVSIREVIDSEEFRSNRSKLTFAVGKNIDGEIILGDIAKLPHMIIAGTTGSGKSVCTNGIIMSILYNATPQEVRLVLIDPKMVEFKIYNGIPHLLLPVVTDPRKAAGALSWAVQEMLKRYKLFSENSVRDLNDYNELAAERSDLETIPRIVIIIDELADLMMAAKQEVEESIARLAQMARAAGMHIIIATQRPTVDVVTGLIKSNIPSRIALRVASGIDSRTILDEMGAEKLLGNGDLLFMPTGAPKPLRVQNCYTSSKEVAAVVDFIKNGAGNVTYDENIIKAVEENIPQPKSEKPQDNKTYEGSDENAVDRAIECAIDAGSQGVSVTYLQRKLKLGYARAARIMDELEEKGIVGPMEGAKPRQVLMTRERYMAMQQSNIPNEENAERTE